MLSVALTRELPELLGSEVEPTAAIEAGSAEREKVQGRWLYTKPGLTLEDALDVALASAESYLDEWLLGRAPFMAPGARAQPAPYEIGKGAMDVLIKELARRGRLGGLALMNADLHPFIAFFRRDDEYEIGIQIEALARGLAGGGRVRVSDLPSPGRAVPREAWRELILRHGEWRGLGSLENGELIAWR